MAHIGDLKPDLRNARKHGERNIRAITKALEEVGAARSIVIDEDNVVLAGNGLVEAAGIAGIENLQIVEADGNTIVAVKRTGLTKKQKQRLAVLDNRSSELAEWDADVLQELLDEGVPLDDVWFPHELATLLEQQNFVEPDAEALWQGMPSFSNPGEKPFQSVIVHFASKEDRDTFSRLVEQTLTDKTRYIHYPYQPPIDGKSYRVEDAA